MGDKEIKPKQEVPNPMKKYVTARHDNNTALGSFEAVRNMK
jgi:hypothetical protein